MMSPPLQLPHGEEMHKYIDLLRFWIVHETGMTNGFKVCVYLER